MIVDRIRSLHPDTTYAAFLIEDGVLDLVSRGPMSDQSTSFRLGESDGYMLLNAEGLLMELELLFVRPVLVKELPWRGVPTNLNGGPILKVDSSISITGGVVVIREHRGGPVIILMGKLTDPVDRAVAGGGLRWYLCGDMVVGLEVLNVVDDPDGTAQVAWLGNTAIS